MQEGLVEKGMPEGVTQGNAQVVQVVPPNGSNLPLRAWTIARAIDEGRHVGRGAPSRDRARSEIMEKPMSSKNESCEGEKRKIKPLR